jgi:hypothetical protein
MLVGHVVDAEVFAISGRVGNPRYQVRFLRHHESGKEEICLDAGQNWNATPGMAFDTMENNIGRAYALTHGGDRQYRKDMDAVTRFFGRNT